MPMLADKVALVTGASSGIGRATARQFAREGARVVVAARRADELDALVDEIRADGGEAVAVPGDVRSGTMAKQLVDTAVRRYGGLDIAFNNAATLGTAAPVADLSLEQWHETIETNLTSAFLAAKYQVPAMRARGGGSLIFTSSFVGWTAGFPGMAAYAASKAGVIGLTRVLAAEHGMHGIRVNALLPGGTDTAMNVANQPGAPAGLRGFLENLHALKRLAQPEEIAQSALYLASDASSFVTGVAMLVDGGVSICRT